MPDEFDRASEDEQKFREAAIRQSASSFVKRAYTGKCYNCDEPVAADAHFCDESCRDDYQKMLDARRRNGGVQ